MTGNDFTGKLLDSGNLEHNTRKGKLKIFFGPMPGVGRTSAMLRTAQAEAVNGRKVVVGIVTWYTRPDTMALMKGLPVIPSVNIVSNGVSYKEMDTKAILEMHPDVALMSDPGHVNAPGSRHLKRYHDIEEMLDNGIDVYTTLNLAQLESCSGFIHQVTGCSAATVPDEFLANADEVELVDIETDQLIKRHREGKIVLSTFPEKVVETIYQKEKISVIRQKFFQVTLGRENGQKQPLNRPSQAKARLMMCIWPDTVTQHVMKRAKASATAIDADWVALCIVTDKKLDNKEKELLEGNIELARQLGGTLITYTGNDPVEAIIEVAHREKISHIVLGKTHRGRIAGCPGRYFINRLLKYSGQINVSVIYSETPQKGRKKIFNIQKPIPGARNLAAIIIAALITGLLCTMLDHKVENDAPPYMAMLLLFMLAFLKRSSTGLIVAALALFAVIVFVIPPSFTFHIDFPSEFVKFPIFSVIALLNGLLTMRIRRQERETFRREKQTNALFLFTKKIAEASSIEEVVEACKENLLRYFEVHVFFIFRDAEYNLTNFKYAPQGLSLSGKEMETATWAFRHNKPAGKFTDVLPSGEYTFYPLAGKGLKLGVLAVKQEKPFSAADNISWTSFLLQIAQSLEHEYLEMTARRTNFLNESDKLYKALFNSISHELRIPISAIMGSTDLLLESEPRREVRHELYGEIFAATKRLNRLVENLLNMSRLETGRIAAHPDWCDIQDLFNSVAENLKEDLKPFHLEMLVPPSMPLVRIDFGLMEQAVHNLVYNATLYAPQGSTLNMNTSYDKGLLYIQVKDRGPGLDPASLNRVFDKFWRSQNGKPGGLGLGLSIVKGFVEAHNGTVFVSNRKSGGARFTIMIQTEKSGSNTDKLIDDEMKRERL